MTRNKKKTAAPKKYASTPRDHPSTVVFSWRLARTLRFKDLAGNGISPGKIGTSSSGIGGSLKMVYPVYPQSHCQALPFQSCHWHTMDVWNPWMFGIHGCFNMFHFSKVFSTAFREEIPIGRNPSCRWWEPIVFYPSPQLLVLPATSQKRGPSAHWNR